MASFIHFFDFYHFDFTGFLLTAGYLGLFAGVFSETGFLFGLLLPGGEMFIFTASVLAAMGFFNIWAVVGISILAAVLADNLEYAFGKRYGPRAFSKKEARFFKEEYVERTRTFFQNYGAKTIFVARFLPFIRTLAPAFAGMGKMPYRIFSGYNIAGAATWVACMSALGYFLGEAFPHAYQYLIAVILAVAFASTVVAWWAVKKHRKN